MGFATSIQPCPSSCECCSRQRTEERAVAIAKQWLEQYEPPALDVAKDEELRDFVKNKKDSMPDAFH